MNILLTNDDGIQSPALSRFAVYLGQFGQVTVIAPKTEQSGKSHAIDFTRDIEIKQVDIGEGILAFSVDSTPADCVRYGVLGRRECYDLVLSGPNRGFNLGKDLVYSGTVGAIFEAARLGIPAVAVSTEPTSFEHCFAHLDTLVAFFKMHGLLTRHSLYNVNIPAGEGEIKLTRTGGIYFTDEFIPQGNDIYRQEGEIVPAHAEPLIYDTAAVCNGYISVTPLTPEKTDLAALAALQNGMP